MGRRSKAEPISLFNRTLCNARGGSLDALGQLFESCRPWLLNVAIRELHHDRKTKTSAADCVQDAFREAQRDFGRLPGSEKAELLNWLRRLRLRHLAGERRHLQTP